MQHVILFDNEIRDHLLPLTFLRPVADLRIGILTIREKWAKHLNLPTSFLTQDYLSEKFPLEYGDDNLLINASVLPTDELVELVKRMEHREAFLHDGELIAARMNRQQMSQLVADEDFGDLSAYDIDHSLFVKINRLTDIFHLNATAIALDFALVTQGRDSEPLSETNRLIGPADQLFIEPGAQVEASTLNTQEGPIYVGAGATIMEGCLIRGPLAMGEHSVLKMGAKIYGATTLGPDCKVGGEVKNVVWQANSSKAHEGYLGNSVIGEWCNIGADTNSSNLKNSYVNVRLWSYPEERFVDTGLQFCGLIMGDHSKTGINTMLNTGTVIGVCCNVFGSGFPRNFIPSFSWGGAHGFTTYRSKQAVDMIRRVMERKGKELNLTEQLILARVYEDALRNRHWAKE